MMTPMLVQCSSCRTEFELDPEKVPPRGVRARCSVCSAVITVPAPPPPGDSRAAAGAGEPPGDAGAWPAAAVAAPPVQAGAEHGGAPAAGAAAPAPDAREADGGRTAAPASPSAARDAARGGGDGARTGEAAPVRPAGAAPAAEPAHGSADAAGRRAINPFLSRDPGLRAKRLARALVSDIVAYHPARHAEGLRDGTLKQLFRDEIKKSYEEYVEQVGPEMAETTTHFRDALNDVLAGGRRIF